MDHIKKKCDPTGEFQAHSDQILKFSNLFGQKMIYAPVPIRNNANIFNSSESTTISNSNVENKLIESLLSKFNAENLPNLNSVSSILNSSRENFNQATINRLAANLISSSQNLMLNTRLCEFNNLVETSTQQTMGTSYGEKFMKNKKSIRKQTSFAVTDEKSDNYSADERIPSHHTETLHQNLILESIEDEGEIDNANVASKAIKSYSMESSNMDYVENRNISNLSNYINNEVKMVGQLTEAERQIKVNHYLDKKKRRLGENNVRYGCRQQLASKRFRFQGRFIRIEDLHKFKGKFIIDFYGKRLLKPIFSIEKIKRRAI